MSSFDLRGATGAPGAAGTAGVAGATGAAGFPARFKGDRWIAIRLARFCAGSSTPMTLRIFLAFLDCLRISILALDWNGRGRIPLLTLRRTFLLTLPFMVPRPDSLFLALLGAPGHSTTGPLGSSWWSKGLAQAGSSWRLDLDGPLVSGLRLAGAGGHSAT